MSKVSYPVWPVEISYFQAPSLALYIERLIKVAFFGPELHQVIDNVIPDVTLLSFVAYNQEARSPESRNKICNLLGKKTRRT